MATSDNTTRTSGAMAVGGVIGFAISSVLAGSIILGGNIHTDSSQNSAPSRLLDTNSYDTYQQIAFTASGSNQQKAQLLNPFGTGGVVRQVEINCGNKANAQNFFVSMNNTTASSGTGATGVKLILGRKNLGTGAVVTSSGSGIADSKWFSSTYVTAVTQSGAASTQNGDCYLRVYSRAKLGVR